MCVCLYLSTIKVFVAGIWVQVWIIHHIIPVVNVSLYLWQIKKSITVGVIGLPNVGKSSLINSLKRSRVVNVGSTPGLTRSMQEVQLDNNVKLLDCPGVVMLRSKENDAFIALRNCKRIEKLEDPIAPGTCSFSHSSFKPVKLLECLLLRIETL